LEEEGVEPLSPPFTSPSPFELGEGVAEGEGEGSADDLFPPPLLLLLLPPFEFELSPLLAPLSWPEDEGDDLGEGSEEGVAFEPSGLELLLPPLLSLLPSLLPPLPALPEVLLLFPPPLLLLPLPALLPLLEFDPEPEPALSPPDEEEAPELSPPALLAAVLLPPEGEVFELSPPEFAPEFPAEESVGALSPDPPDPEPEPEPDPEPDPEVLLEPSAFALSTIPTPPALLLNFQASSTISTAPRPVSEAEARGDRREALTIRLCSWPWALV
jgi:hypothetical protein